MDLRKCPDAGWCLILGGVLAVLAVFILVRYRHIPATLQTLFFGAAFMTVGSLGLMGFMAREWVSVSYNAVFGICLIFANIATLSAARGLSFRGLLRCMNSELSPEQRSMVTEASYPEWVQWTMLVIGVGSLLWAVYGGLFHYWS